LVLWRHGQTAWNAERRFQGQSDIPLDRTGQEQAERAARLLAALRPDLIVSSDLIRATSTAAPLARLTGLDVVLDKDLRERHGGAWEGLTDADIRERYPTEHRTWSPPDGEPSGVVADRVAAALLRAATAVREDALAVVVSQGRQGASQVADRGRAYLRLRSDGRDQLHPPGQRVHQRDDGQHRAARPDYLLAQGVRDMVRISDARMSGTSYGACVLHVAPESFVGGPLAFVQTGDLITLDVAARELSLDISERTMVLRREQWQPPEPKFERGYGVLYTEHITQANEGCDFGFLARRGRNPDPDPK